MKTVAAINPDRYLKEHGKCPPGYHQDETGKCVKTGSKKRGGISKKVGDQMDRDDRVAHAQRNAEHASRSAHSDPSSPGGHEIAVKWHNKAADVVDREWGKDHPSALGHRERAAHHQKSLDEILKKNPNAYEDALKKANLERYGKEDAFSGSALEAALGEVENLLSAESGWSPGTSYNLRDMQTKLRKAQKRGDKDAVAFWKKRIAGYKKKRTSERKKSPIDKIRKRVQSASGKIEPCVECGESGTHRDDCFYAQPDPSEDIEASAVMASPEIWQQAHRIVALFTPNLNKIRKAIQRGTLSNEEVVAALLEALKLKKVSPYLAEAIGDVLNDALQGDVVDVDVDAPAAEPAPMAASTNQMLVDLNEAISLAKTEYMRDPSDKKADTYVKLVKAFTDGLSVSGR